MDAGVNVMEHLDAGGRLFGLINRIADASVCEMIGQAGFDFIMVDCEHAPFSWHDVQGRVIAAQNAGLRVFVRPPSSQGQEIGLALDLGADGIHVPHVMTLPQAETICDSAFFAPLGKRGFALSHRGAGYGAFEAGQMIEKHNREVCVILHIEDPAAVDNVDEIVSCSRASVLFVAPFDLSYGLGFPGDLEAKSLWDAYRRVADAARSGGAVCGTYVMDYRRLPELADMGYQYFLLGGDLGLMRRSVLEVMSVVKSTI